MPGRGGSGRQLRDRQAVGANRGGKVGVSGRVVPVKASGEHRDSRLSFALASGQRGAMGVGVDAVGEA